MTYCPRKWKTGERPWRREPEELAGDVVDDVRAPVTKKDVEAQTRGYEELDATVECTTARARCRMRAWTKMVAATRPETPPWTSWKRTPARAEEHDDGAGAAASTHARPETRLTADEDVVVELAADMNGRAWLERTRKTGASVTETMLPTRSMRARATPRWTRTDTTARHGADAQLTK